MRPRPVVLALVFALGCAERPPPAPLLDGGRSPAPDGGRDDTDSSVTRPARPDGGPRLPSADEEITLPYLGEPVARELEVAGEVGTLDVFFAIDTTGSFGGEIDELQAQLRSVLLPEIRDRVADVAVGVGRFEDFPRSPFGVANDVPFRLLAAITTDESRVAGAVASLDQPLGNGGDFAESGAEALYQIATGEGLPGGLVAPYRGPAARGGGTLGGVGFREGALRVVVLVTDAPTHEAADYALFYEDAHGLGEAIGALTEVSARTIGIASGDAARPYLEQVARGTGAVVDPDERGLCRTGVDGSPRAAAAGRCPLVFDVRPDGTGLSGTIVDAITDLLATVQYGEVWAETDDTLGLVRSIEALEASAPPGVELPTRADRRPAGDGIDDTFVGVRPGTQLRFRAVLQNETIAPADYDQYFNLTLRVRGDGVILATRRLRILVPRGRLDAGVAAIDAGADAGRADAGRADAGADAGTGDGGADAGTGDGGADAGTGDGGGDDAG